jgi:nitroreductase
MDALELLLTRASINRLQDPAPTSEALDLIFRSAVRAPDHGRLRPWRFVVIADDARERFGDLMAKRLQARQPDIAPEMLARERQKAFRAPVIVAVAAAVKSGGKIPEIEQILAAGAAAQNIMLAAHALGYGAMWKTGEPAYDPEVKQALGLDPSDAIVGFIYIGTPAGAAPPLPRPDARNHVIHWRG